MSDPKIAMVTLDDLWDPQQIIDLLEPLKQKVPQLVVTCFTIPNKFGEVHFLARRYPWLIFAQHGREHTPFECRIWTEDFARWNIQQNFKMGYANIFKPPNWTMDEELERAARAENMLLVVHDTYQPVTEDLNFLQASTHKKTYGWGKLIHSHITRNPATSYMEDLEEFTPEYLRQFDRFLTPIEAYAGLVTEG